MRRLLPLLLAACSGAPLAPDAGPPDAGATVDAGEPEIVRAHNAVRARAMPVPMPALPPLTWNQAAADFAAAWVDGCNFSHNPGLGTRYGENIYASTRMGTTPTAVVEDWASEEPNYDYAANTCAGICGHYTQIVWRSTVGVGCAWKVCSTGSPFGGSGSWEFWVCDYTPPGNFNGQRPY